MGDTWVHGPGSDPWKLAAFRVMQRKRSECLKSNLCSLDSYPFYNFSRLLLKVSFLFWLFQTFFQFCIKNCSHFCQYPCANMIVHK